MLMDEPNADWVSQQLNGARTTVRMSTVNYTEALILIHNRRLVVLELLQQQLERIPIELVPVTIQQAEIAAEARARFPLNLGDCFAYALAKNLDLPLLTLDRDFRRTDVKLVIPPDYHRSRT